MAASTEWQLPKNSAQRYEEILVPAIQRPAARVLVENLSWLGGEKVLDAGFGTGWNWRIYRLLRPGM